MDDRAAAHITFLAIGDWRPGQVRSTWINSSRPIIPEVEQTIDRAWAEVLSRPGVHLFDGPMCRLESWRATPEGMQLELSPTSYKIFLGTNMSHPELADRFGPKVLANPVGVSSAVLTADGRSMLGRRTANVAYYPSRLHPFAGALEPRDAGDAFGAVLRELKEEIGLERSEVTDCRCAGIVLERALRQPELILITRVSLSASQIEARLDEVEHREAWSSPVSGSGLEQTLADADLTPVAIATTLLAGRAALGMEWFSRASAAYME